MTEPAPVDAPWRLIVKWKLWETWPRSTRLVAHIERWQYPNLTRCGQPISERLVALHVTAARALGAEDCKSCLR